METQNTYLGYQAYKLSGFPSELVRLVTSELQPGETIRWAGQPRRRTFLLSTVPVVFFGIPWTAFAVFWTCAATGFSIPSFERQGWFILFPLWGVPFILIGLVMLSAPLWAIKAARNTAYVITDRRAIIFEGEWNVTVRSVEPPSLKNIYRREKRDGRGDIILQETSTRDSDGDWTKKEVGFKDVENVREVERLVKSIGR
jgi:hypothetical protein